MADAHTAVYNFTKPEVGGAEDTWGASLNANFDAIEALLTGAAALTSLLVGTVTATGQIKGIAPAVAADLTRKDYVDAQVATAAATHLALAGGTVTGQIKGIAPAVAADLTRKDYVDTQVATRLLPATAAATYLALAGGTVTGQIKGIAPAVAADLTRKDYVDAQVATRITPAAAAAAYVAKWTVLGPFATTSGTAVDTAIPTTATEVEILFDGVSLTGTDDLLVQLGVAGVLTTTGYASTSLSHTSATASSHRGSTSGFVCTANGPLDVVTGSMSMELIGGDWYEKHLASRGIVETVCGSGIVTLSGLADVVRVKTTGANSFDAGAFILRYR